jgi:hypothetical protein
MKSTYSLPAFIVALLLTLSHNALSQTKLSFYYDAAGNQTSLTVTITTPRGVEVNPGEETTVEWLSLLYDPSSGELRARNADKPVRYTLKAADGSISDRGRNDEVLLSLSSLEDGDYTLFLRRGFRKERLSISVRQE